MRFVADISIQLLTKDLSLSVAMSAICPSTEVDEVAICLLTVFEQRGLTFDLFEALIKQEVEDTGINPFPRGGFLFPPDVTVLTVYRKRV